MRARSRIRCVVHGIVLMALCTATAHAVSPIVIWVTNSNNFGAGSFSAALAQLQPIATPQEIRFSYPSTQTIYLNGPQSVIVGSDVRIDGADMAGKVIIDGAGWTQVTVPAGSATARLTVANLTLRHGQQIGTGGCVKVANAGTETLIDHAQFIECKAFVDATTPARGGAVYAAGALTVADSSFERNEVLTLGASAETNNANGGALSSEGAHAVTITRSAFRDNRVYLFNSLPSFCSSGAGGAVHLYLPGASSVGTITDSTFTGNNTACRRPGTGYDLTGVGDGGAASLNSDAGTFNVERNFFENNTGNRGGALAFINDGTTRVNIINNTLHANRGMASGGGVSFVNCCYAKLINNTFSDNRSGSDQFPNQYGGAFTVNVGTLDLVNNLIDHAAAGGSSCSYTYGQVTSSHNLYSDAACPLPTADPTSLVTGPMPWLGAPKNLGGYVLVMPPAYGSPAIDGGDDARCATYDARGVPRPLDGDGDGVAHCDIGALESSLVDRIFRNGFDLN
ncbi:MAG: right-handed parallel beta-helix repeat-containing protein [Proteobacteria bacterium]|nr:right-handed parallel beta-helix repeat-containing protein [Pseudomonadota bacterium]